MRVDSLKVRRKGTTSNPPPSTHFLNWCYLSLRHINICCHTLFCKFMGCAPFRWSINLLKKKLTAEGSLPMFLFSFRFFFCLLLTLNWTPASYRYLYKSFWFFSLNFSGEIFRRTGHPSRQFGKIIDVLWPWFLYCKIISRTCVQSKMGQPSLCFSSR